MVVEEESVQNIQIRTFWKEEIRGKTKRVYTSVDVIETRQLFWYRHVLRMGKERWPTRALEYVTPTRRTRLRPTMSWREDIVKIIKDGLLKKRIGEINTYDDRNAKCGKGCKISAYINNIIIFQKIKWWVSTEASCSALNHDLTIDGNMQQSIICNLILLL